MRIVFSTISAQTGKPIIYSPEDGFINAEASATRTLFFDLTPSVPHFVNSLVKILDLSCIRLRSVLTIYCTRFKVWNNLVLVIRQVLDLKFSGKVFDVQ